MTGKGTLTRKSQHRFKILMTAQVLWVVLVFLLGAWWSHLVLKQAQRISVLELQLGIRQVAGELPWEKTQRMLYWESASFLFFLLASMGVFIWFYWQDVRRARSIQAFFASVTHELRTPLTSIRLQAEFLAETTDQPQLAERLIQDTVRLETQVERTLELARMEGGGPLHLQPLNLRLIIERFLKTWTLPYTSSVKIDNQVKDLDISADPSALQIILKNIVENSIRHGTPIAAPGSATSVSGEAGVVRITLSAEKTDRHITLHIQDSGNRFQGDPWKLGELFHKGPNSQGAGVGLYLVNVLMKRMGGKTRYAVQNGFRVSLQFPAAPLGETGGAS
ncbi:MAG: HAMP domain-containing histidine kinase [Methylotenera sp.]|nr:HAMP domain-containing histidine kinase [Oligoflexia bacterium]